MMTMPARLSSINAYQDKRLLYHNKEVDREHEGEVPCEGQPFPWTSRSLCISYVQVNMHCTIARPTFTRTSCERLNSDSG